MEVDTERQEDDTVDQLLSEDLGEIADIQRDILPSYEQGQLGLGESLFDDNDYNLNIAVDIAETDYEDIEYEFADSITEMNGKKVFPCSKCNKICKSKGGLTKHNNSKHGDPERDSSSQINTTPLCLDTMKSIVETIKTNIVAEKLYGDKIENAVKDISATEALFKEVLPLYTRFCRKKNQDKLLESFYGLMLKSTLLLNCKDSRVANLVMIHIPDHLVGLCNVGRVGDKTESGTGNNEIQPNEHGPLSYIVGYVLSKLIKASKGKTGDEKSELQTLLQSLVLHDGDEETNEFITARTRGGLCTPCEDIVRIIHEAEICFREDVNQSDVVRNISVDRICFSTIQLPIVKSLWDNIVLSSGADQSCQTNKLCLENIITLFLKVRSFSYTKDYITKYKIKEKQGKTKALRKDLKKSAAKI